ncbi:MAG: HAMP domain-containing sensor histidine kinase [Ekhidna sp.]|uniref:sensor histidine kinase n=1 Tax=Ekhidna sp. TaxID=2608089 RepID=UPI0032EF8BAD
MAILKWIEQVIRLGSLPDQPYSFENRRILLLNKIAIVATVIITLIVIIHILIGNKVQPIVVSLGLFISIPSIWLQSINRYRLARNWFLIGFFSLISGVFFHSIQLNLETDTEYVIILLIPLTLIFLDGKTSIFGTLFIILSGAFFIAYRYTYSAEVYTKEFFGLQINWLATSVTVFFCMNFFKRSLVKVNELIARDKEELAVADKTKNFLFAVISHDIRSPLNTLKQYFLLDPELRKDPEQFITYQGALQKKVDDISQTLDDLLFWSKSQLQGINAKPSALDIEQVISKVMTVVADQIEKKEISVNIDLNTKQIWCDPDHLTVVIRNLVQNALKFSSRNGKLSIGSHLRGDQVSITITDTGKGMDQATLQNLKDGAIVKSHLGTAGEVGTGLGLSLVKELISKNHGEIDIESEEGVGTVVSLFFPSKPLH